MSSVIRNRESLSESPLRRDALLIAEAGYAAIDTAGAIERKMRIEADHLTVDGKTFPLAGRKVFFVGVGKCAVAAAAAIEKLFGERLSGGIALDVSAAGRQELKKTEAYVGTHPLPSDVNEQATRRIMEFLSGRAADDLVVMLISGGGSTLLCLHDAPMRCLDESALFTELTARGAPIRDLNTVRKHLSRARGGGLAKAAYPADVVALIVSDVPGNDIEFIASGPTALDASTVPEAEAVLARYGIDRNPDIVFVETPKEPRYFERVRNILFLTSRDALLAMREAAGGLGYRAEIASEELCGEARDLARLVTGRLHEAAAPAALLYAGESTVALGGSEGAGAGVGGRNQEFALAALADIRAGELVLPFSSDGRDNTDHAGAIADELSRARAAQRGASQPDALARHDSYGFFAATGDFLDTGALESNVSDLVIALKK